ncbi:apolipoprotein D-like [Tetranychus urticae]|uniref:Lipocalin/cytosolic fatty-acid binding domain-containing protein n=1 Tax=Tetranychus urticae TaxID=32264 RepID=T1K789_TETUR|nr:apolipoprotein D-like [Tetranychus urticae]
MKMIATLFVVFAFASQAFGQCTVPPSFSCPNITKIAGRWYEIAGPIHDLACVTMDFTPREDGNFNYTIIGAKSDGSKFSQHLLATRTGLENSFNVSDMSTNTTSQITYYIANTDYDNFLVLYACVYLPGYSNFLSGSIFSRTNTMSDGDVYKLKNLLVDTYGVPSDSLVAITQKGCKYWPVF